MSKEANRVWEASMPPNAKPFPPSPISEKDAFVRNKYLERRYLKPPDGGRAALAWELQSAVVRDDVLAA
jgi:hypothetical protein